MTPEEAVGIVMQPHDDITPLIPARHPNHFELSYMLHRLQGVREHVRTLYGLEMALQLWTVVDAMSARLGNRKNRTRRPRAAYRRRASRDRISSLNIVDGLEVLEQSNKLLDIEFKQAFLSGITPEFTLRFFPHLPDWSKTFFGNQMVVNGVPGWRRCVAVVTHPLLIASGKDMFTQWLRLRQSPEFQAARLSHSRQKKISRILNAATQGVTA